MTNGRDAWPKNRGRNGYLTEAEKVIVLEGFKSYRPVSAVARQLGCSSRTITKYYGFHRAEGIPQGQQ